MKEEFTTISAMCAEFDVTPRTLRFYEAKELLFPQRVGQKRLFSARDKARLKLILRGKRFGFSLDQIREWLALYEIDDGGVTQINTWLLHANKQIGELEAQRDELNHAIDELKHLINVASQELDQRKGGRDA